MNFIAQPLCNSLRQINPTAEYHHINILGFTFQKNIPHITTHDKCLSFKCGSFFRKDGKNRVLEVFFQCKVVDCN